MLGRIPHARTTVEGLYAAGDLACVSRCGLVAVRQVHRAPEGPRLLVGVPLRSIFGGNEWQTD